MIHELEMYRENIKVIKITQWYFSQLVCTISKRKKQIDYLSWIIIHSYRDKQIEIEWNFSMPIAKYPYTLHFSYHVSSVCIYIYIVYIHMCTYIYVLYTCMYTSVEDRDCGTAFFCTANEKKKKHLRLRT